jgi:hypothetical protein
VGIRRNRAGQAGGQVCGKAGDERWDKALDGAWETGGQPVNQQPDDFTRQAQFPSRARIMKQPLEINSRGWDAGGGNYFKEVLTELNLSFKVVPSPFTAVMIASAIPAAIRAYSIAVAPDSSDQSLDNMLLTSRLHSKICSGSNTRNSRECNLQFFNRKIARNWKIPEQKFQKLNPAEP